MKLTGSIAILLACAGICATVQARSEDPTIATMNCAGNLSTQINLVGYQIPIVRSPLNIGSQSSGAGAGKVVFTPIVLDAIVGSNVLQLSQLQHFSQCVIRFRDSALTIRMALVAVNNVTLVSDDEDLMAHESQDNRGTGTPMIAQITLEVGAFKVSD